VSGSQALPAERLIERLLRLSQGDRDWILAHLSPGAKTTLLRQLGQVASSDTAERPALEDELALDALEADTVGAYLVSEPSWVIAMIMSIRTWRWEHHVLTRLAPVTRLEVNQLRNSLAPLSAAMKGLLTRTLREQLPAPPANPRFEQLLDRARERAI
jgi:hypothetical protein